MVDVKDCPLPKLQKMTVAATTRITLKNRNAK